MNLVKIPGTEVWLNPAHITGAESKMKYISGETEVIITTVNGVMATKATIDEVVAAINHVSTYRAIQTLSTTLNRNGGIV